MIVKIARQEFHRSYIIDTGIYEPRTTKTLLQ